MKILLHALFFATFGLAVSDFTNYIKETNEKCCKEKFSDNNLVKCQNRLENQLSGSRLEDEYNKKINNPSVNQVASSIDNACKAIKSEFSAIEVTPEQYAFLVAACSTYEEGAKKSFAKYFANHNDILQIAVPLGADYFQLLYEYDNSFVERLNNEANYATTVVSENFKNSFNALIKKGKLQRASPNPGQKNWWSNWNFFRKR